MPSTDRSSTVSRRRAGLAAIALASALVAGACAADVPGSLPGPTTTTTEASSPAAEAQDPTCTPENVTQSLRPDAAALDALATRRFPSGSRMDEIAERGRLRVGVDTSTLQFSSVNPRTGRFEGFDIAIAREIAAALLGSPDAIEFVAIPYGQRLDVLQIHPVPDPPYWESHVDIVVDTFTINCARDDVIDFSTEYFTSAQMLLVRRDSGANGIADLGGKRVCAATGSTSIDNLKALPEPRPIAVGVTEQAECLVLMQQGRVDAISTDDTILAGMAKQDPNLVVVDERLSAEPYGVGMPSDRPELLRFVNAVLEQVRSSGRWTELYNEWLSGLLPSENVTPPEARYED